MAQSAVIAGCLTVIAGSDAHGRLERVGRLGIGRLGGSLGRRLRGRVRPGLRDGLGGHFGLRFGRGLRHGSAGRIGYGSCAGFRAGIRVTGCQR